MLERDRSGDGRVNIDDLEWRYLEGDGDFRGKDAYDRYDNYDAIEVPFTDAIPSDYDGVMGVPISFLDKWPRLFTPNRDSGVVQSVRQ